MLAGSFLALLGWEGPAGSSSETGISGISIVGATVGKSSWTPEVDGTGREKSVVSLSMTTNGTESVLASGREGSATNVVAEVEGWVTA